MYSDSDRDHVLCSQDSCKTPNPAKNYLGKSGWEQEHAQPYHAYNIHEGAIDLVLPLFTHKT